MRQTWRWFRPARASVALAQERVVQKRRQIAGCFACAPDEKFTKSQNSAEHTIFFPNGESRRNSKIRQLRFEILHQVGDF